MILAGISALLNFVWLPHSPWWSLMVIAIDILMIWALANYHREPASQGYAGSDVIKDAHGPKE